MAAPGPTYCPPQPLVRIEPLRARRPPRRARRPHREGNHDGEPTRLLFDQPGAISVADNTPAVPARWQHHVDADAMAVMEEDLTSPCTEEIAVFQPFARTVDQAQSGFVVHLLERLRDSDRTHVLLVTLPEATPVH